MICLPILWSQSNTRLLCSNTALRFLCPVSWYYVAALRSNTMFPGGRGEGRSGYRWFGMCDHQNSFFRRSENPCKAVFLYFQDVKVLDISYSFIAFHCILHSISLKISNKRRYFVIKTFRDVTVSWLIMGCRVLSMAIQSINTISPIYSSWRFINAIAGWWWMGVVCMLCRVNRSSHVYRN